MTFDELKALLREWYEAGREIDLKNPDSLERFYGGAARFDGVRPEVGEGSGI